MTDCLYVLASASPRRKDLLQEFGIEFHCFPAEIDESLVTGDATMVACGLSVAKAYWSYERILETDFENAHLRELWVIGSDTVVAFQGRVIGKPVDEDDAREILRNLSGCTHQVVTGVAVLTPRGEVRQSVEMSSVTFRELSDKEIDGYVASGDAMGKAGAYGIQSGGASLVESVLGCYYNIVGLPVRTTFEMLDLSLPKCGCDKHPLQSGDRGCDLERCARHTRRFPEQTP